jgi:fumarate reductase flavoprotein subunit
MIEGIEEKTGMDRRGFLKGLSLGVIGAAGAASLAACAPQSAQQTTQTVDEAPTPTTAMADEFVADETQETDIVVIGCGGAGFVASNIAAKQGAKVIVLEKGANMAQPNGIYVSGPFGIGTDVLINKPGGSTLGVDEVFQHVMDYSHWTPNPALMKRCLETSKDAIGFLSGIGYAFQEANFRFETPFKGEKGGFHLITTPVEERDELWTAELEKNGVEVSFSTAAVSFVVEGGSVTGVNAVKDDSTNITYKAKAVIMASGGYLGNLDLQERFLKTRRLNVARGDESICTGDCILAAEEIGAALDKTFGYCPCEYGGTHDDASRPAKQDKYDQNTAFKFGLYGCLLVDAEGKRFINEGLLCDYPMSYGSEQILKNSPWYAVVDQDYVDAMTTQGLYNYTIAKGANEQNWFIGNYFKERILTNLPTDLEEGIKEGWCFKANTIEELAEHFGLDELTQTVDEYNGFCAAGVDSEFGANPWYLSAVGTPPYYVTENDPSAWSTFGGVRIDDCCRVLAADTNDPIPGLYAAGTDAGSLYYSPYYDVAGYCYGLCIDSGYIAGMEASAAISS